MRTRTRRAIGLVVILTAVPSVWLAYGLVQQELFMSRAELFIARTLSVDRGTFVVGQRLDPNTATLRVNVVGEPVSESDRLAMEATLANFGLEGATLEIVQARAGEEVDVRALREQVTGDLYENTLVALDEKSRRIVELEEQLEEAAQTRLRFEDICAEIAASYPQITDLAVGRGTTRDADGTIGEALLVTLTVAEPLSDADRARLESWLAVRAHAKTVTLSVVEAPPEPKEEAKR